MRKFSKLGPDSIERPNLMKNIEYGNCVIFIGEEADKGVLPDERTVAEAYAEYIGYPGAPGNTLAKLAQFRLRETNSRDLRSEFLEFSIALLRKMGGNKASLDRETWEFDRETWESSDKSLEIGSLRGDSGSNPFEVQEDNVHIILAKLPIRTYITASHFNLLELALQHFGKTPRTLISYPLTEISGETFLLLPEEEYVISNNLNLRSTVEEPVVLHLHGFINYPDSLKLTENDYTEQLINLKNVFPTIIRVKIYGGTNLVLGYRKETLSFKFMSHFFSMREKYNGIIQIDTGQDDMVIHTELPEGFNAYFGTPQQFAYELYVEWQSYLAS